MKIINKTKWSTEHLREFVRQIAERELEPSKRKRYKVIFKRGRITRGCSGYAAFKGSWSVVVMPVCCEESKRAGYKQEVCAVIAHEMNHSAQTRFVRYKTERNMRGTASARYGRGPATDEYYKWAEVLPLDAEPPKAKPSKEEVVDFKLTKAQAQLKAWDSKIKRAQTWRRKWAAKVKRLELKMAATRCGEVEQ